ncbi:MAG TPA: LPS export ABC transporter periplasmic protein LptC [Rhizomicrobium sp.]|nr:LPS export ABC transporter periplasmic protein LptC [Rhizomicrobium sp.]
MAGPTRHVSTTPPSRDAMDWNTRARTTAQESLRYTRFVGVMKRSLLVAALAVLALVLVYALLPRPQNKMAITAETVSILKGDLQMLKPRLTGLDDSGSPYVVTADTAIQDAHHNRRAKLFNIDGDLTQKKDNSWISLHAPSGLLEADIHKLHLNGPIAIFSDDGYEAHTMAADVDLSGGIVRGKRMIVGQGPLGNLRADKFALDRDKHMVFFYGNVRMTIYPNAMKKSGAAKPGAVKKGPKTP